MARIKLLAIGDHVAKTGFSRVLESILTNLPDKDYDVSVLGVNYFGDPHPLPYRVYPAGIKNREDPYGMSRMDEIIDKEKPEVIFLLNDAWILTTYLEKLKQIFNKFRPRIVTYIPVDAKSHWSVWYDNFDFADKIVTYTQFGKAVITDAMLRREVLVIPHGVDTGIFYKIDEPKEEIKKRLFPKRADFYEDSFIVFNGNRNQPRKRIDITMRAFEMFSRGKPENVKLYMHCGVMDSSINVIEMANRLKIQDRLILTSLGNGVQQVPEGRLNLIYNATDLGVNTSLGEGWGLVNTEHAATGAPQVVPENSANVELFGDCGILVPTVTDYTLDNIMTLGSLVRPEDVAEKFELMYTNKEEREKIGNACHEKFTSDEFQWKNIVQKWDKLFKEVQSS